MAAASGGGSATGPGRIMPWRSEKRERLPMGWRVT